MWVSVPVVRGDARLMDPRNPEEWRAQQAAVDIHLKRWPKARIRQLEGERERILSQLSTLPRHVPKALPDRLGYHSSDTEPRSDGTVPPHELTVEWVEYFTPLHTIGLVPAFNPADLAGGTYAFPKRFKIEGLVNPDRDEWVGIANWLEEDFPDPGPYPVVFPATTNKVKKIRITVPQSPQEFGEGFFALGEVYLFRELPENRGMGDNMAVWAKAVEFSASDTLLVSPLWNLEYLCDSAVGLGLQLSEEVEAEDDLLIIFEDDDSFAGRVEVVLDLGRTQSIGRIEVWPAEAPNKMAVPMFGFPGKIVAELSADPDFGSSKVIEVLSSGEQLFHDDLMTIIGKGYPARYIRLWFEDLPTYKDKTILSLGEISVEEYGQVLSLGCAVTARGLPEKYVDQIPRLVDGFSRRCRILREGEWIIGLAMRKTFDSQLARVERELVAARESWSILQLQFSIWGMVVLVFALLFGWGALRWQRRQVLERLKMRITRDLHDDVGSSLGSISLMADQLRKVVEHEDAKEDVFDLSLLAREACASLREVVWMVDQKTIRLPDLLQKLVERAERVMSGMNLSIEISPDCPDIEVSLMYKRHLLMLFKEVVHNCVRHAQATRVWLLLTIDGDDLQIVVRDDGRGFEPEQVSGGWGLKSMKKRAEEMDGRLNIISRPGEGTTVNLHVPLSKLNSEPKKAYSTSN